MACMLAVFDWDTARAPVGLESVKSLQRHHSGLKSGIERQRSEELCHKIATAASEHHAQQTLKAHELGRGNGFVLEGSPFCRYCAKDGVHVLFAGEVSHWPGVDTVSEAHDAFLRNEGTPQRTEALWLLDFYSSLVEAGVDGQEEGVLESLSSVEGRFAFIIFDEYRRKVLAARDAEGKEALFWGVTEEGQLLIGTDVSDLVECEPTAVDFPAGTLYVSHGDTVAENPDPVQGWVIAGEQWPGQIFSFVPGREKPFRRVKEIPRVNSKGVLCGSVFRVESERDVTASGQKDVASC